MVKIDQSMPVSPRTAAAYLAVLDAARLAGSRITRTKMAKLLYLADLRAVEEGLNPISGIKWKWLDHGPFDNSLMHFENRLVSERVIGREPYYYGWEIFLTGDYRPGFDMPEDDIELLRSVVNEFGGLAATTLKDMSYQTPPMVDAQKRGRGAILNLDLARRLPGIKKASERMAAVLRSLPNQEDDDGAQEDLVNLIHEFSDTRGRANGALLGE